MTYTMSDAKPPVGANGDRPNPGIAPDPHSTKPVQDPVSSVLTPGAAPVLQLEAAASDNPLAFGAKVGVDRVPATVPRFLSKLPEAQRPVDKLVSASPTVVQLPSRPEATGAAGQGTGLTEIPEGWTLRGNMIANNPVSIAGKLEGDVEISSGAVLTIERTGAVDGTLTAAGGITVAGRLKGHINAPRGSVRITDTAFVDGKVTYNRISMDGGQHRLELVYVDASGQTD